MRKAKEQAQISIVGAGRLGGALALALARCGYTIRSLASQRAENAARVAAFIQPTPEILAAEEIENLPPSEIVLIAAPDPEIETIATRLARNCNFKTGTAFLHTSGSLSSAVLSQLKNRGAAIGSLHPLVSISDAVLGAEKFAGVYFCVEGDEAAVAVGKKIAANLGGNSFELETRFKPLYHAAAVMAAGHLVALFDAAAGALALCGLEKSKAQQILLPLAASAVENLKTQTPEAALTGTFARADLETMRRHLAALAADEDILKIYQALGKRSLELALKQGANAEKLQRMSQELSRNGS